MNVLINDRLDQYVKFGKIVGCQVIVIGQSFGFHAKRASGLTDIPVFDGDCEMFSGTIATTIMLAIGQVDNLFRKILWCGLK